MIRIVRGSRAGRASGLMKGHYKSGMASIVALTLLIAAVMWVNPAAAQQASVVVGSLSLALGETGTVEITANNFTDPDGLAGFDFTLAFDPAVIQMDGVRGGDAPFAQAPVFNIDNVAGQVKFNSIQISMIPGPTEDLLIAQIDITAVGGGNTDLTLSIQPGGFIDTTAAEISAGVTNGRITVLVPPTATPTATPNPISTPAPTAMSVPTPPLSPESARAALGSLEPLMEPTSESGGPAGWGIVLIGGVVAFAGIGAGYFLARRRPAR